MSDGPTIRLSSLSNRELRTLEAKFLATGRTQLANMIAQELALRLGEGIAPSGQAKMRLRQPSRLGWQMLAAAASVIVLVTIPSLSGRDAMRQTRDMAPEEGMQSLMTIGTPVPVATAGAPGRTVRVEPKRRVSISEPRKPPAPTVAQARLARPVPVETNSEVLESNFGAERVSLDVEGLLPADHCDKGLSPSQQLICEDGRRVAISQRSRQKAPYETRVVVRNDGYDRRSSER